MFADLNRDLLPAQRVRPRYRLAAAAADRVLDELGVRFRSLPHVFQVEADTLAELERATRVIVDAQVALLAHLGATREPAELNALFEIPPAMASNLDCASAAHTGLRMLRADIVPTATGYQFCEVNHFSGVGAGEAFHSAQTFADVLGRPVAGTSPFRQLALLYADECARSGRDRIVVLDTTRHRKMGYGEHIAMQRYFRLVAPDLELAYHDELTFPPRWLRPAEADRTLVHRIVTLDETDDDGALLVALRSAGALVSCMFEAELLMHRRWLALLCDERHGHLLDAEQRRTIERYVPHTVAVEPETIDAAVADRRGLVFKRSYTYGGQGVVMGDDVQADALRALLTGGAAWVAQRRVTASTLDLPGPDGDIVPHALALGMYLYGDGPSGLLVRAASNTATVNVTRGSGASWAFAR